MNTPPLFPWFLHESSAAEDADCCIFKGDISYCLVYIFILGLKRHIFAWFSFQKILLFISYCHICSSSIYPQNETWFLFFFYLICLRPTVVGLPGFQDCIFLNTAAHDWAQIWFQISRWTKNPLTKHSSITDANSLMWGDKQEFTGVESGHLTLRFDHIWCRSYLIS